METNTLSKIGLTDSETKVYTALLRLGQTTVGPIVDSAQVTRSKIYDILERLKNKGLVSSITKGSTKYFSAADPKTLLSYIEDKKSRLEEERQTIQSIMPQLLLQQQMAKHKKTAEIFTGMKGLENAFEAMVTEFSSDERFFSFGAGKGENTEAIKRFFTKLHSKRIQKKVKSLIIFNKESKGQFKQQENSPLVEARYLEQTTPTAINIYKDTTIIAILTKEPITLLVKNKEAADSFKEYFWTMWKTAKR